MKPDILRFAISARKMEMIIERQKKSLKMWKVWLLALSRGCSGGMQVVACMAARREDSSVFDEASAFLHVSLKYRVIILQQRWNLF